MQLKNLNSSGLRGARQLKAGSVAILAATSVLMVGCTSIHSNSVRDLIEIQGHKIQQAEQASNAIVSNTKRQTDAYRASLKSANEGFRGIQLNEAKQALVFSANQDVSSKTGVDAEAAAYMIAAVYLRQYEGLERMVNDQFAADFEALERIASEVPASWKRLSQLHKELDSYAKRSVIATVDNEFVSALMEQVDLDSSDIDRAITASKHVNTFLTNIEQTGLIEGRNFQYGRQTTNDLLDLLGRMKTSPPE